MESDIIPQAVGFRENWKLLQNRNNPQSMGNAQYHTTGTLREKLIYSHTIGFD